MMVSTCTGMAVSPCVRISLIAIVTGHPPASRRNLSGMLRPVPLGCRAGDAHTVLLSRPRAAFAGPVQSLGRAGLASIGAAARRRPRAILQAARGFILPGKGRRAGLGTKHFRPRFL